jgi:murein DD-endopeptidase MepM/ murein hydrolase activator NlpD
MESGPRRLVLRVIGAVLLVGLLLPRTGSAMRPPDTEAVPHPAGIQATTPPRRPAAQPATYIFPVRPASAAEYGAYHHDYPATDIFCPVGSRFVAPTSGVVQFVSRVDTWDPRTDDPAVRGGLSVAIIGDDRVRYYGSHLSAIAAGIAPGARVQAGQLLGLTGHSGDARTTAPHLHFGISRPTGPTDWQARRGQISPYKYLQAWAAGKALTPVLPPAP